MRNYFLDRIGQGLVMLLLAAIIVGLVTAGKWLWALLSGLF